jgi:4'-phosphopantetheinyl transferase
LDLSSKNEYYDELKSILTTDEISRASRFHFAKDKHLFTLRRGILRSVLAHYQNSSTNFTFSYEGKNKPCLANSTLSFNLSHSKNQLLIAITNKFKIGIDIEFMDTSIDVEQITRSFFTSEETEQILLHKNEQQFEAFYNCWTRKEAYIKALAQGLYKPLKSFQVSVGTEAYLFDDKEEENTKQWKLININIAEDFKASLAINQTHCKIYYFH